MALDEFTIHRDFISGDDTQMIANFHLVQRDFLVTSFRDETRDRWGQIEQSLDRAAGPPAGAKLDHLT